MTALTTRPRPPYFFTTFQTDLAELYISRLQEAPERTQKIPLPSLEEEARGQPKAWAGSERWIKGFVLMAVTARCSVAGKKVVPTDVRPGERPKADGLTAEDEVVESEKPRSEESESDVDMGVVVDPEMQGDEGMESGSGSDDASGSESDDETESNSGDEDSASSDGGSSQDRHEDGHRSEDESNFTSRAMHEDLSRSTSPALTAGSGAQLRDDDDDDIEFTGMRAAPTEETEEPGPYHVPRGERSAWSPVPSSLEHQAPSTQTFHVPRQSAWISDGDTDDDELDPAHRSGLSATRSTFPHADSAASSDSSSEGEGWPSDTDPDLQRELRRAKRTRKKSRWTRYDVSIFIRVKREVPFGSVPSHAGGEGANAEKEGEGSGKEEMYDWEEIAHAAVVRRRGRRPTWWECLDLMKVKFASVQQV